MGNGKISYAGIGAAVAGVIGILGIYSTWWESDFFNFNGTADISIRRVTGALATLFAVVLTLSCVWGLLRTDNVAPTANVSMGLFVSGLGGVLGIAAGFLVMRDSAQSEAEEVAPMASDMSDVPPATGAEST